MHRCCLPQLALVLIGLVTPAAGQERAVPYEEFLAAFRQRHDLAVATAFDGVVVDLLERRYLRAHLGRLDVRFPTWGLEDKKVRRRFVQILQHLLELQQMWVAWRAPGSPAAEDAADHVAVLDKWIRGWKDAALAKAGASGGGDLLDRMVPKESHVSAAAALVALLGEDEPGLLVLAPERRDFLEWCCYLGSMDDQNRDIFWQPSAAMRVETWVEYPLDMQVLALEYAHPVQENGGFTTGLDMNAREKNGLMQHVVHRGALSLLRSVLGAQADASLVSGLAQNLTIEVCGEDNTRSGGHGKGMVSEGIDQFVPQGGIALGVNLDSPWRVTKGKSHYLKVLARSQRAGAKLAGEPKHTGFFLLHGAGRAEHALAAPMLGAAEGREQLTAEFVDDFHEFHRAYRCGFVHWLRTVGPGSADAEASFGELLSSMASGKSWFDATRAVYGLPLTGARSDPTSLEWSFLSWLRTKY